MSEPGTAIERLQRSDIDRAGDRTTASGAIVAEVVPSVSATVARESHARRAELASRILSLLAGVGSLALRVVEARADARAQAAAVPQGIGDTRVTEVQGSGGGLPRRSADLGRGRGGQRQRHRRRGTQ